MEVDFGITEYLGSPQEQMSCVLKHLYSDFIVKEISSNGDVCGKVYDNKNFRYILFSFFEIAAESAAACIFFCLFYSLEIFFMYNSCDVSLLAFFFRKRSRWPKERPNYLHFTLSKENKDAQFALSITKVTNLGTRGTKDRRAVTAQRVSLYRYTAERVKEINARLRGIRLSDFTYEEKPCILGDLWGNRFQIALRKVLVSDEELKKRVEEVAAKGFINYFGTQRFGSCGINTASVGKAIVKGEWKEAVDIVLGARDCDFLGCLDDALKVWHEKKDASLALSKLSGSQVFASIECRILKALSKGGFKNAFMCLPRSGRSLYVHAFQSLLWNQVIFWKLTKFLQITLLEVSNFFIFTFPHYIIFLLISVAEWYDEILKENGIKEEMFADFEFEVVNYADVNSKLQPDLDGKVDERLHDTGEYRALLLSFTLPAGSYATMALREITRFCLLCDMGKLSQVLSSKEDDSSEL
ncbi:unnamed protein product [Enterobius vermicularis]|uniref:TRUD domain-containing protein n=1 Tax=Enterobius vermicularis TaxID=51028 RepID=A0A0N4VB80_ENTVE|nr:unnamed protein product [Enterobius vermicularis]